MLCERLLLLEIQAWDAFSLPSLRQETLTAINIVAEG